MHNDEALYQAADPRTFPPDLAIVLVWEVLTIACIFLPVLNDSFLRVLFALPFILFLPGYTLIAALFPGREEIDGIERLALSFGLSIAVAPLIGLVLNYTPWGIRLEPITVSLVLFTTAMTVIAHYRRFLLPAEQRYSVPFREMSAGIREELFEPGASRMDRALSVLLVVSIIAAAATTVFVIVVPKEGEKFTEFYILGEKGMAADYPTRFTSGEEQHLIIGIGNHEYRNVSYTVEVLGLNQTFDQVTNTSTIHQMALMDRFTLTIPHNTTEERWFNFTVGDTTVNRIQFLLYNETVPDTEIWGSDRVNASYRDLHLWVTVLSPLR